MNFYQEKLNQIRIALGMEVKMAEAMLKDGVTKVEAEAFEAGKKIFVVSESGEKSPAPLGTHETEDGTKVTVDDQGVITLVEKPEPKEEEVEVEIKAAKEDLPPTGDVVTEEVKAEEVKTEGDIMKEEMKKMVMECMAAIEEVAKEVSTIKEEMAAYKTKMEKLSAEPASSKFSTFNANPAEPEKISDLDARLEQLKSVKAQLNNKKRF